MNTLSTHILDTALGLPACGIKVTLHCDNGKEAEGITNENGRCASWGIERFPAGLYRLRFHCREYFTQNHNRCFFPYIDVSFELTGKEEHYHVPLLLSPFGYSTYRSS